LLAVDSYLCCWVLTLAGVEKQATRKLTVTVIYKTAQNEDSSWLQSRKEWLHIYRT
jgi:hypothetical protein